MRFPVNDWESWYSAQKFGDKTEYGYHDGEDINLKTGGDTDLGQPIYAIADGEVTSVHSHIGKLTFGKHIHIVHDGGWGRIWCHYAHCQDIHVKVGDRVKENQKVATLGKSGTTYAHLHWAIKAQPTGIDGVAKTQEDLKKWLPPIDFVLEWSRKISNMDWLKEYFNTNFRIDLTKDEGDVRGQLQRLVDALTRYEAAETKVKKLEKMVEGFAAETATWEARYVQTYERGAELEKEIKEKNRAIVDKDTEIFGLNSKLKNIEGKICISEEEYNKLSNKECLARFTLWQHIWYKLRKK